MLLDPESEEMGCDLPFIPNYTPRLVLIDIEERGTGDELGESHSTFLHLLGFRETLEIQREFV